MRERRFLQDVAAQALGTLVAAAIIYLVSVLSGAIEPKALLVWAALLVEVVFAVLTTRLGLRQRRGRAAMRAEMDHEAKDRRANAQDAL